jgi:uncharacterized protein (TIGR03437 family)
LCRRTEPRQQQRTLATPQVTIGGISAMVASSALAQDFVGLNQVNLVDPSSLYSGISLSS